jgi:hypothetical protein
VILKEEKGSTSHPHGFIPQDFWNSENLLACDSSQQAGLGQTNGMRKSYFSGDKGVYQTWLRNHN